MFDRPHHRRIATVLEALDAQKLADCECLFGGGTAIALAYGEFRESVDIDFLVSSLPGYRQLRQLLTGLEGINALVRPGQALVQTREVRADQYGLRTLVKVDDVQIKLEIILEGRITLDAPLEADKICGLNALTTLDKATCKLLANSDRWRDDSVMSRDLIDLAMMQPKPKLLAAAIAKAKGAYGESISTDLSKAISYLQERPHRLDACMQAMHMTSVAKAVLHKRIRALTPKRVDV